MIILLLSYFIVSFMVSIKSEVSYNLQAGNIRLFFHKRKDILLVCIREFWLLTAEIGLSFINIVSPDLFQW